MSIFSARVLCFLVMISLFAPKLLGQQNVSQLIVASGGAFSNPNDFVSISVYHPQNQSTEVFGEIRTQAVQDVIVYNDKIYVTATDSIVVFDALNHQRLNGIAMSGVRYLLAVDELLFVSIQYPQTSDFVKVLNINTLEVVKTISQISGESAGMLQFGNKVFVAVPGDWTSTVGKVAVLDSFSGEFIEEVDFGTSGSGIHDLFAFNGNILSVNRSAWGVNEGIISMFNPLTRSVSHHLFPYSIGKGIAVSEEKLFLLLNNGIGEINLQDWSVSNAAVVPDPGSASFTYFADIVFDPFDQRFYATITDYFSMGEGKIFDVNGLQTGSFYAGISAEALALDFDLTSSNNENEISLASVWPNPAPTHVSVEVENAFKPESWTVYVLNGAKVPVNPIQAGNGWQIDVTHLKAGIYQLLLQNSNGDQIRSTFIKM